VTLPPTTLPQHTDVAAQPAALVVGRPLAVVGTGLAVLALILMGSLHVLPPSNQVNPIRRTISEYALGANGWLFDLGVIALAAGSALLLVGLVRARVLRAGSAGSVFLGLWVVALVVLVVFEKTNWSIGPSIGGYIHRYASLAAFLSLPIGALLAAASGARHTHWRRPALLTRSSALVALLCFSPLVYAIAQNFVTNVSWWRVFPLGILERLLGLAEVAVVLVLGWWVGRAGSPASTAQPPGLPAEPPAA
jgi:hypothetical protein